MEAVASISVIINYSIPYKLESGGGVCPLKNILGMKGIEKRPWRPQGCLPLRAGGKPIYPSKLGALVKGGNPLEACDARGFPPLEPLSAGHR